MWEKLSLQERDRRMGRLCVFAFLSFIGFSLLALGLPKAAGVTGILLLLVMAVWATRSVRLWLICRSARAPVGPLSVDEKFKARSKLLHPRTQLPTRPVAPSAFFPPLP